MVPAQPQSKERTWPRCSQAWGGPSLPLPLEEQEAWMDFFMSFRVSDAQSVFLKFGGMYTEAVYWQVCFNIYSFIYLAAPHLCCNTHDLSLVVALWIFSWGMWDLVPWSGTKPGPPAMGTLSFSHWPSWEVPIDRSSRSHKQSFKGWK